MRSTLTIFITALLLSFTFQEDTNYPQDYFSAPVGGVVRLSGTFGELRPGHFHAGIDIKGSVGNPILAAADGYISRITVSPGGYGKVLYLSHPNGYTTIYAHLDHFRPEVEAYVRGHQYAEESYSVNLRPEAGQFPCKKGGVIGAMGITGNSFGPHLHFEVGDEEGALAVNPLNFGLPVADRRTPFLDGLRLYAIGEQGNSTFLNEARLKIDGPGSYRPAGRDTLYTTAARTGLALAAFDRQDGAPNRNGVYALKLFFNDSLAFHFDTEYFHRRETNYLNAHLDYHVLEEKGGYFNRLYTMPGNAFSTYRKKEGAVALRPGEAVRARLEASDINGNTAVLAFWLKRIPGEQSGRQPFYNYRLPYGEASIIQTPALSVYFPQNSFYEDLYLHYEPVLEDSYGIYSLVHHIHYPGTAAHHSFQLGIRPTLRIPDQLKDKAFVAYCGNGGAIVNCGGEWKDGFLQTQARSFGAYCILTDDEPPTIEPLNWREDMTRAASMAFRISDNFRTGGNAPGLQYRGTIDGHWVLFEYDAKNNRLEYFLEDTLAQGEHQLRLEVKDAMGNEAVFERRFRR